MKLKYCLTGLLCLFLKSDAQLKPLTIGDKVPGAAIKNIYNYPALQSMLSAFNNKLLILDFMATNCSSCIKALPSFDALQKKYDDKIQILLVTNQSSEKVKTFLHNHAALKLPMIAGDTVLEKLFPHTFISHEVWIHKGFVKAITHPEYVTSKNIESVLSGEKISWPVKRDMVEFDYSNSLLKENIESIPAESASSNFFYTTLTKYIPNVAPKFIRSADSSKRVTRTLLINMPVIEMYRHCYGLADLPISHIMLKVKDTVNYIYDKKYGYREKWKEEHTYCYEAILPYGIKESLRDKMVADLNFYLGMLVTFDTIITAGYELHQTDTSLNLLTKEVSRNLAKQNASLSLSVQELISLLNNSWYSIPTFNETGLSAKDYLNIPKNCEDNFSLLQTSLAKYGLQLHAVNRKAAMLIIREKN